MALSPVAVMMNGETATGAPTGDSTLASLEVPTVTAVVGVYNGERFIGETLTAILGQTRRPDEVVVVDDGSTDGTAAVLAGFGEAIRVVGKPNGGCPSAFNRAFREARGDYIAMCGADDVWEPEKLAWQLEALQANPDIDMAFGGARNFGENELSWAEPPGRGILDRRALIEHLFSENTICASSIVIRRRLCEQVGPFVEAYGAAEDRYWNDTLGMRGVTTNARFSGDDYDYWMRALKAGAIFHYDPRLLVRYRRHGGNVTRDALWVHRSACQVRHWHADLVENAALRRSVQATDMLRLGRLLLDAGHPRQARAAFWASVRRRSGLRGFAWTVIASLPRRLRARLIAVACP
jgi:glycosyltransferase involved in cell wall biosynthesis